MFLSQTSVWEGARKGTPGKLLRSTKGSPGAIRRAQKDSKKGGKDGSAAYQAAGAWGRHQNRAHRWQIHPTVLVMEKVLHLHTKGRPWRLQ